MSFNKYSSCHPHRHFLITNNHQARGSTGKGCTSLIRGLEFELWEHISVKFLVVELCHPCDPLSGLVWTPDKSSKFTGGRSMLHTKKG